MGSLQRIKEHSGKWFVKALLWVLVASFALWGVGDMVTSYTSMRPIAKVGGYGISREEFDMALQRSLRGLQQASKTPMTGDDIRKAGIPKLVLDQLLNQAAVREEIHRLKLVVSDSLVQRIVQSDPMFHNEKGVYDPRALQAILQSNHFSEAQFVNDIRTRILQEQLMSSLASGANLPQKYMRFLFETLEQKRVFAVVSIPMTKMPQPAAPTDQELTGYFDQHKADFTRPEVRTLAVLELDLDYMKSQEKVSEDQVKEAFESRREEFSTPEKRQIDELTFGDEISAKLALGDMAKAKDLTKLAKKYKGQYEKRAQVAKADLVDGYADEVFSAPLNKPQLSKANSLGHKIFRVKSVVSGKPANFAEARKVIEGELKTQQINDALSDLRNKVEDALAGGEPYEAIAKAHNLKAYTFEAVAKDGKSLDGKIVIPDAMKPAILEQDFSLSEMSDSPVIDGKEGSFYVVRALKVTPSMVPEFSDIKPEITKAWEDDKRTTAAMELAESISKEAKTMADLSKLAASKKLSVKVMEPVNYSSVAKDKSLFKAFSPALQEQMFALKEGRVTYGPAADEPGAQVIMVQSIKALDSKETQDSYKKLSDNLKKIAQQDVKDLYIKYLRDTLGVTINNSIYEAIVGAL